MGSEMCIRDSTQKFYVAGLNQDLQRLVTAQLSELALLRKCIELEASQSQNKKATVRELSTREEDIMKEQSGQRGEGLREQLELRQGCENRSRPQHEQEQGGEAKVHQTLHGGPRTSSQATRMGVLPRVLHLGEALSARVQGNNRGAEDAPPGEREGEASG